MYFIRRLFLVFGMAGFLAACATTAELSSNDSAETDASEPSTSDIDAVIEPNSDQLADLMQESLQDLPLQELDATLLKHLLIMNLASIDQDWGLRNKCASGGKTK